MGFLDSVDKKYHPWIYGGGFLLLLAIVFSLISGSGAAKSSQTDAPKEISFPAVVLIKSEQCGYCVKFKPTWAKLSSSGLKTKNGAPLRFIEVDTAKDAALVEKFPPVDGVPSIRYHYTYDNFAEYSGNREYDDLVSFIKDAETGKEGYAVAASPPSGTGADPTTKGKIVRAPDGNSKDMLPATVPGAPATGVSITANKASYNMLSDKVYEAPPALIPVPAARKDCRKETRCDYIDYTKKPSSLGAGINPTGELFYTGSINRTNLTDRAYPQGKVGGMYLLEQW